MTVKAQSFKTVQQHRMNSTDRDTIPQTTEVTTCCFYLKHFILKDTMPEFMIMTSTTTSFMSTPYSLMAGKENPVSAPMQGNIMEKMLCSW